MDDDGDKVPEEWGIVGVIGAPEAGPYRKILDSDAPRFGGSAYNKQDRIDAQAIPSHGYPCRMGIDLPPLGAIFLEPDRDH